jgi:hypothetical protein
MTARAKERLNILDDVILFLIGKLGKHGKREDLAACPFAFGKIALFIAQMAEAGLKVEGKRIINFRAYPTFSKEGTKRVAFPSWNSDCVLVEDMGPVRRPTW